MTSYTEFLYLLPGIHLCLSDLQLEFLLFRKHFNGREVSILNGSCLPFVLHANRDKLSCSQKKEFGFFSPQADTNVTSVSLVIWS